MMKKAPPAESPDAYVAALTGWQRPIVEALRAQVQAAAKLEERIKWGHIVCFFDGPLLLIRAEEERVLFGFWRGKRMREIEPRLTGGGKYEMGTVALREGDTISAATVKKLVKRAVELNTELGDATKAATKAATKLA